MRRWGGCFGRHGRARSVGCVGRCLARVVDARRSPKRVSCMRPITDTSRHLTALLLLLVGACQRETPMRSKDTARQEPPPPPGPEAAPVVTTAWDTTVGAFVVVPAGSNSAAYVIYPEFTSDSALDSVSFSLDAAR